MSRIEIHYDFCTGEELPYFQAMQKLKTGESFSTNCISLFSFDRIFYDGYDDVVMVRIDGGLISAVDLLNNVGTGCDKQIRRAHSLQKLFCSGALSWGGQE